MPEEPMTLRDVKAIPTKEPKYAANVLCRKKCYAKYIDDLDKLEECLANCSKEES